MFTFSRRPRPARSWFATNPPQTCFTAAASARSRRGAKGKALLGSICCVLAVSSFGGWASAFERIAERSGFKAAYALNIPQSGKVLVQLTVHAGEVDFAGPEGMAHYLEHLVLWQGEGGFKAALTGHRRNAKTGQVTTSYHGKGAPADLPLLLGKVKRYFSPPDLPLSGMIRERQVVLREYDVGAAEDPYRRSHEKLGRVLYGQHPLSRSVLGTPRSINALTARAAVEAHGRLYKPANATLVIIGDVAVATASRLIEQQFPATQASGPASPASWKTLPIPKPDSREPIVLEDAQLSAPNLIYRQFAKLDAAKTGDLARKVQLLNDILTGSLPGSLPGALIFGKPVASEVLTRLAIYDEDKVELSILLRPEREISLERADDQLKKTLSGLRQTGVPAKTLKRVLKRSLRKLRRLYRHPDRVARLAGTHIEHGAALLPLKAEAAALTAAAADNLNGLLRQILTSPVAVTGYNSPPSQKVN